MSPVKIGILFLGIATIAGVVGRAIGFWIADRKDK